MKDKNNCERECSEPMKMSKKYWHLYEWGQV